MTAATQLERLLASYGFGPGSECAQRFQTYLNLLLKWNRRINLVGSTSWEILAPLFEEGLWASRFYPREVVRHLDIGSGAGFPALPLRIVNRDMELRMVESRSKRAAFLETAAEALGLSATRVSNCTLEMFLNDKDSSSAWDCVSWKAIRLDARSLALLVDRAGVGARFWMFHGGNLPIEGGEHGPSLELSRCETMPGKPSWHLSVFVKRQD